MGSLSLRQQAYGHILAMIERGELAKGAATSEVQLARQLDMSRTPVRAALQQLELEGYVRIAAKHGIVVLDSSSQRVGDLLELIAAMALFAVGAASASGAGELRELSQTMAAAFDAFGGDEAGAGAVTDPGPLLAFEYDLLHRLISLGHNGEMVKCYQNAASRLFWRQNKGRWRAPYSLQTREQVERLIRAVGSDFETYRLALLDYLRTLKMTWQ